MELYSVKMRGSKEEAHISGAENIVTKDKLEDVVNALIKRSLEHSKGSADFINIKIEKVESANIEYLEPLEATTIKVSNKEEGFAGVKKVLRDIGVDSEKVEKAVEILHNIKGMRGAVLLDINSMQRLEVDKSKGVRVTYMDLENRDAKGLIKSQKYNTHFIEALVLTTKVMGCTQIIGEICYSDDPDYTAGYVATKEFGYVRFDHLKEKGSSNGGRVFLYDSSKGELVDCINYLEKQRVIVRDNIKINENVDIEKLMECGLNG
ncbi:MAG: 6-carboxyhexanoate--CoA ligase [Sarcina sp.]